jgi:prophage maintenance system killer protein
MLDANQFATLPEVLKIVEKAIEVLTKEKAILKLSGSFVIIKDIHGNLDALARIFDGFGYPGSRRLFSLVTMLIEIVNHVKLFSFYMY